MSPRRDAKTKVVITRNFEANLERIENFLLFEDVGVDFDRTRRLVRRIDAKALARLGRLPGGADAARLPSPAPEAPIHSGQRFDRLLDELIDRVVPLLERTPRLGPPFNPSALSHESRFVLERIRARLDGGEVRQLVRGDFLLLYLVSRRGVALLAIRHHRERGFKLGAHVE